jgi:hypothetical protein
MWVEKLNEGVVFTGLDINGNIYIGKAVRNDKEAIQIYQWVMARCSRFSTVRK